MRTLLFALLLLLVYSTTSSAAEREPSEQGAIYWESSQLIEAKRQAKNQVGSSAKPSLSCVRMPKRR